MFFVVVSLLLPFSASAADEPTQSDQTIIPAGDYRFKDQLTPFPIDGGFHYPLVGTCYGYVLVGENSMVIQEVLFTSFYCGGADAEDGLGTLPSFDFTPSADNYAPASYYSGRGGWLFYNNALTQAGYTISGNTSLLQDFTVSSDTSVDSVFASWFYANIESSDPAPTKYTILAGYYKARDSWNTSGFPVTNDSIDIRYYDSSTQSYVDAEGIAFLIENDTVGIYYQDVAVYADGWNDDGAKNIQVLQDISVDSDFYTVFNNIYASSSEGSNDFDSGYASGYADGRSEGYDIGYQQGYMQGLEDGDANIFVDIIGGTLAAVDSFTIFGGFSLLDLISTLLGGMALVWILKLLAGG